MANVKQYNLTGLSANVELGKKGSYLAGSGNAIGFYTVNGELQKLSIGNAVVGDQAVTLAQLNVVSQDLVQSITVPVAFNGGGPVTIANVAAGSRILTVTVEIDAVWTEANTATTFIEVGDSDSSSRFIRSQDVDVTKVGQYHSQYQFEYLTAGTLTYSVTQGSATAGNATITVTLANEYDLET